MGEGSYVDFVMRGPSKMNSNLRPQIPAIHQNTLLSHSIMHWLEHPRITTYSSAVNRMWRLAHTWTPSMLEPKQEDCLGFEAGLSNTVSSKPGLQNNPVS